MAKLKTAFFCTECGNETARWQGQCPACNAWNTLTGEPVRSSRSARAESARGASRSSTTTAVPVRLADVSAAESVRWSTGISELDFVLGGGVVPGSLVLVGGEPGI